MELSDLCNFEDKLYSFDDRTGMGMIYIQFIQGNITYFHCNDSCCY